MLVNNISEDFLDRLTSYEIPPSSLSTLCRTYLEDIRIVLGITLEVLVRSPNPRFNLDIQDLDLLTPTSFCRAYNIFACGASINSFCRRTACRIVFLATYGLSRWIRPLSSSPMPRSVKYRLRLSTAIFLWEHSSISF